LAPFEHLCSSNPVIVSGEMGAAGLIEKFELGVVCEDGKYGERLLEVYSNLKKYKDMGSKASKVIKRELGWDRFTDKMIEGYKRVWRK